MDIMFLDVMGKPLWMWLAFLTLVTVLLAFDLGVLHRKSHEIGITESLLLSAFYITLGIAFGGWIWWELGGDAATRYLTGFVIEKSLAMDNIFVIALIFGYFSIPRQLQHRVLVFGILGVVVLRGIMIGLGAVVVERFEWVLYLFAVFLVFTGIKMLLSAGESYDVASNPVLRIMRRRLPISKELHGERFLIRLPEGGSGRMRLYLTPLLVALILVEIADVIFAVDSIPAIFAITTDPYLVYTSNIFAILGLRALFFALSAMIHRFVYLKYALALVLVFIGGKIIADDMLGFGHVPPLWSLAITLLTLAAGIAGSLWTTKERAVPVAGSSSGNE